MCIRDRIPEDPECQLMQFLCAVGCQKKINIPVIVFGGQDMVGAALRIFRDLTGTVLPPRFPRILISCGQSVSDIPELTSSASNASLASALSLLGKYPPYFYEGYLQNQDLITQLQDICSSIYRDYLSSDREKLYVDSASYAAFFKDSLNAASLLRYGTYLLHYLSLIHI